MGKWVLMVTNYDSSLPPWFGNQACDPQEVIYQLTEIDNEGNILNTDGYFIGGYHGWRKKMEEALNNKIYEKRKVKPKDEPEYKAIEA